MMSSPPLSVSKMMTLGVGERAIGLGRRRQAAQLNLQMRLGHAPIFAGRLDGRRRFDCFAEGLDGNARHRSDMLLAADSFGGASGLDG